MSTTALHIADAPRFASQYAYTCARCEHEELKKPVFLSNGLAYGTRCAAVMLGLVPDTATVTEARKALKVAQDEQRAAVAAERAAKFNAEQETWEAFLAPHGASVSEAITALGGFTAARAAFAASKGA